MNFFNRNTGIIQDFSVNIAEPYSTVSCTVTFPSFPSVQMYNPQISAVSRLSPNESFKLLSHINVGQTSSYCIIVSDLRFKSASQAVTVMHISFIASFLQNY